MLAAFPGPAAAVNFSAGGARRLRMLELFCGIGGAAAALEGRAEVSAAIDIHPVALRIYAANFGGQVLCRTIESLDFGAEWGADSDLWWLSPPCQPYTRRGRQRDLDDYRTAALLQVIDQLERYRPRYVALENVPQFAGSHSHRRLIAGLSSAGYETRELQLCPTALGVPNRRSRYYLVAGPELLPGKPLDAPILRPLADYLDPFPTPDFLVSSDLIERYAGAMDIVEPTEHKTTTACFTSAYGRSPVRSGSYLRQSDGVRRFTPREILRFLGFPESYQLPTDLTKRQLWPLVGNSLSIPAVRHLLAHIPELSDLA